MKSVDVVRTFQRRARAQRWGIVVFFVIFAAAVLSMWLLPSPWPHLLMFAAMMSFIPLMVIMVRYRCPACGAKPVDEEGDDVWNPDKCSNCGVRLR
jgi:DNA-directed RNA polymerase subunit RPC12/RpoP